MDTENKNVELEEETVISEEETTDRIHPETNDELKDAIEGTLSKIRNQAMVLGFRVCCQTIFDKLNAFDRTPGSKSNNDHKRLIKDIRKFVETGLSRNINENGEVEIPEETTQN